MAALSAPPDLTCPKCGAPWRRIKARAEMETHDGVQDAGGFVVGRED